MNDTEMEILQGTISAVVFQNYENGYAVLRLAAQDGNTVTVVGTMCGEVVLLFVNQPYSMFSSLAVVFQLNWLVS